MARGWQFIAACLALFVAIGGHTMDLSATRLKPDLRVFPQYFSIAQDAQRQIYIGATDGLLRYDGSRWHWLATPKPGAVRALEVDSRGRLWVGGDNFFGYLERAADGTESLVDVSPAFAAQLAGASFTDVWEIAEFDQSLFINTLNHVFRVSLDGAALQHWQHAGRFGALTALHGKLYLQWRDEGLRQFDGKGFSAIPGTVELAKRLIVNLLPTADGGMLVHDARSLHLLGNGSLTQLDSADIRVELPQMGTGIALGDDQFMFAGSDGIVRVLNLAARSITKLPLGNAYIAQVARDRDGALLALDDEGILRFSWPSPITRYGRESGISGDVYALKFAGDWLYIVGADGAHRARWRNGLRGSVTPLNWSPEEVWDVLNVNGELLFAESRSLLKVIAEQAPIALSSDDFYPRVLHRDPNDADLLWVGSDHGLALLRVSQNFAQVGWRRSNDWQVTSIANALSGVWLGTSTGVFRAQADAREPDGFSLQAVPGLPTSSASVHSSRELTLVSAINGIYRLREGVFVRDDLDGLGAMLAADEELSFMRAADGALWAYSYHSAYVRKSNQDAWRALVLIDQIGTINTLSALPGGDALLGTHNGFAHYRQALDLSLADTPALRVEEVSFAAPGQTPQRLRLDQPTPIQLGGGGLTVSLGFSDFAAGTKQYQVMLAGFDDKWSDWSTQDSYRFFALPAGEFRLRSRARRMFGPTVEGADFAFVIVPRWYERQWVLPTAVILLISLLAGAALQRQRGRVSRLRASNDTLDELVIARTEDLARANVQLRELAERDGLTGIANRRRFDHALRLAIERPNCGLILIDADHFKSYNDRFGHPAGDELLKRIAAILSSNTRSDTMVARYGGEEFALIVQPTTPTDLSDLAERLRACIEAKLNPTTVSLGVALAIPNDSPEALILRTDAALYRAKGQGRNRVEIAGNTL